MTSWITSTLLLRRLQDFDERSAWNLLADHFQGPVVDLARRRGLDPAAAEDAAQETLLAFARAYRDGKYERTRGRLEDWLFGIAQRQIRNALRRSARDARAPLDAADEPADEEADAAWDAAWRRAVLARCLDELRGEVQEKTFSAFRLVALLERPPAEVAGELGMSVAQVYDAKYRVSARLQELVARYEDA